MATNYSFPTTSFSPSSTSSTQNMCSPHYTSKKRKERSFFGEERNSKRKFTEQQSNIHSHLENLSISSCNQHKNIKINMDYLNSKNSQFNSNLNSLVSKETPISELE